MAYPEHEKQRLLDYAKEFAPDMTLEQAEQIVEDFKSGFPTE